MMGHHELTKTVALCMLGLGMVLVVPAEAQTTKLKMHTANSPVQVDTKWIFEPLRKDFEKHSGGTLTFQVYYGMALGGTPRNLIPQTKDGVVDMSYTLPAYAGGRFPILTGVELPFLGGGYSDNIGEVLSQVAWDWVDKYAHREFKGLKLITLSATGGGILHTTKTPVRRLEDFKGLKIRVPGRYVGKAVESFGGVPVQMPLFDVYQSLSRGQTQGMMISWMTTIPFKLLDVNKYHTDTAIYVTLLMTVMNKETWNRLTAEQKKAVEFSTGKSFAKHYGSRWDKGEDRGRAVALEKGNEIIKLSDPEIERWRAAARSAQRGWIDEINDKGLDGKQMFADLIALVNKYSRQ